MTSTASLSETRRAIAENFANGAKLIFQSVDEYKALPKADREEYVTRILLGNQRMKESIEDLTRKITQANKSIEMANARIDAANREILSLNELKQIAHSKEYALFNRLNRGFGKWIINLFA